MTTNERAGGTPTPARLLTEFPAHDLDAWQAEVERLLKGASFAEKMTTRLAEGLAVSGMCTAADTKDGIWGASLPGQAPYLRGAAPAARHGAPWLVAQELAFAAPAAFNAALRQDLARGQNAIVLRLDATGAAGRDPGSGAADAGSGGTSIIDVDDLAAALRDVDLPRLPLMIRAGGAGLPAAAVLAALLQRRGIDPAGLTGFVGGDPLGERAAGAERPPLACEMDQAAVLARWAASAAPGLRTIAVGDEAWHEGGADRALSLGLTLAAAVDVLRGFEARGLAADECARRLQLELTVGSDFFLEIAALRALRVLWHDVLTACGCPPARARSWIHASTSRRTLARRDRHVNLLRATTQAMSAVLGGADSLHVRPFDEDEGEPRPLGRRLARNLQLILAHECHLDHVIDPAGGAWYIERLTRDLAAAAWEVFQDIERLGGLSTALSAGLVQQRVAEAAARRDANLAVRRDVLVGVNQFAPTATATDEPPVLPAADWLQERRRSATTPAPDVTRADPAAPAVAQMERLVAAAAAGATLGGLAAALAPDEDSAPRWATIPLRRDDEPFVALAQRVSADAARRRVHCLCLGDVARYMPRLEFVRRFLAVGGFTAVGEGFHTEAAAAAEAVRDEDAGAVVLVGLDETYADLGVATARLLAAVAPPPLLLVAGKPACLDELAGAGVGRFIHLRSDVLAELTGLFEEMGGRA